MIRKMTMWAIMALLVVAFSAPMAFAASPASVTAYKRGRASTRMSPASESSCEVDNDDRQETTGVLPATRDPGQWQHRQIRRSTACGAACVASRVRQFVS